MRRDLPAAARARARLRRRRASSSRTSRDLGDLAPVPVAVAAGAVGLDARLRRRRPDARLATRSAARRACARCASAGPAGSCSTSSPTTWASRTRTAGGPTRSCARSSSTATRTTAGTGASSTSTTSPRCASRTTRSSRVTHGKVLELVRDGRRRRAARRPSRRPRRPGRLPARGCATPARAHVWVEKILAPRRAAARLAGRGHGRLRVPQRRRGAVRRPGRRGRADRAVRRSSRARRGRSPRSRSRRRSSRRRRRSRARSRGCARCSTSPASPTRSRRCRSTAPTSSRGRGRVERRRPRGGRGGRDRRAPRATCCCSRERGHDEFVTRFQQTSPPVTAKGVEDTAFYRYNRLLALNEVGGDPARFGHRASPTSTPRTRSAPSASRAACSSPRRTTRSARATCARGSARSPGWRASGASTCCAGARSTRPLRAGGAPDANEEYLHLPDARRRLADRRRAPRGLPREGAARGQAQHELGRAGPRLRGARSSASRSRCSHHEPFLDGLRAVRRAGRRGGAAQRARPAAAEAHRRPGVADIYQGDELEALVARRPRQPPAGRLGGAPRGARRAARRRRADARDDEAAPHLRARSSCARGGREAFAGAYEPRRRPARACAPSCAAATVLVVVPVRDWRRRGGAAGLAGRWRDVLTGEERDLGRRGRRRRARRPGRAGAARARVGPGRAAVVAGGRRIDAQRW